MSKFKQSSITPKHRGKMGNIIFSENRYGPYSKLIAISTDKKTVPQVKVRTTMGNLSHLYSNNLNKEQYQGWKKLVPKMKRTDTSGNKYLLAPRDIFTAFNFNLTEAGLPILLDPPKTLSVQSFSSFKFEIISESDNKTSLITPLAPSLLVEKAGVEYEKNRLLEMPNLDIRLFFKPAISKNTRIIIFATRSLSNSLNYFRNNHFKKIGYIDSSFKSGDSIFSMYMSLPFFKVNFKDNSSFQIAFRLKPVSSLSGFSKGIIEEYASIYQNI